MNESPQADSAREEESGALSGEFFINTLRRYWLLILLMAAAGAGVAYYFTARLDYKYSKTASVMLRSAEGGNADPTERVLKELGADTGTVSLANESFVLKSTALMQRVVEELGLNTTCRTRENLRMVDLYGRAPVLAVFSKVLPDYSGSVDITLLDDNSFTLSYETQDKQRMQQDCNFGEPVELPFGTLTLSPTAYFNESWHGRSITLTHRPALSTARELLSALSVTRPDEKDSSLLELSISASSPALAEVVLDTLIKVYNLQSIEERYDAARKTEAFIRTRLAELDDSLRDDDRRIADSGAQTSTEGTAGDSISAEAAALQELDNSIFRLRSRIRLTQSLADAMQEAGSRGELITVENGDSDAALSGTIAAYNEACLEYRRIAESAGERNPIIVAHREQMAATLAAATRALEHHQQNLEHELSLLLQKRSELEQRLAQRSENARHLTPLLREHKVREALYMLLLTKEQENALALAIATPGARVLESAHGPDSPVAPHTSLFVLAGAGGGASLCMLLLVGFSMMDNSVKSRRDISAHCSLPVLAELPLLKRREIPTTDVFIQNPHSPMAEGLHILRNNAENFLPARDDRGLIILLTSTRPNEGKSFIAANLAATFARTGHSVLMVDTDLRKTSLSRRLGGRGRAGLTSFLLHREKDISRLIHPIRQSGNKDIANTFPTHMPDILYAGPEVPHPVTLLSQPLLGELLQSLSRQYDIVLVDAPPCGVMADADIIAAHCDMTLYIIRAGSVDKRYLRQVEHMAKEGKLPHTALVLNAVNFNANSYSSYGYAYSYYRYDYRSAKEMS